MPKYKDYASKLPIKIARNWFFNKQKKHNDKSFRFNGFLHLNTANLSSTHYMVQGREKYADRKRDQV